MGSHHRRFSSDLTDAPCRLAPKHRVRVVMPVPRQAPQIVWLTNDLAYARRIAAQLNALAGAEIALVEQWNDSQTQPRWNRAPREMPPTVG